MIGTSLFPYSSFPIRLEHEDRQKGMITCFFQVPEHLDNYINRHKIDRKKCIILKANEIPETDELPLLPVIQKAQKITKPTKKINVKNKKRK